MKIAKECYFCIYKQAYNLTEKLNLSNEEAAKVLQGVAKILSEYYLNATPPEIAARVYKLISEVSGIYDPFKKEKEFSIKEALELKGILKKRLLSSKDSFADAVKIALAGNVIDFGVNKDFDIKDEVEKVFKLSFRYDDTKLLREKIKTAKDVVYLADNAGENIFDEVLIEEIKKLNPRVKIYYVVRGRPVINDVTIDDIKGLEIEKLAEVVDSKVPTPGFHLKFASEESKRLFFNADLVISKGMGNFECLYKEVDREVFYLFKVKCEVVKRAVNADVGDYVVLKG